MSSSFFSCHPISPTGSPTALLANIPLLLKFMNLALIHSDRALVPLWWQKASKPQLPLQPHSKAQGAEYECFTMLSCWLSPAQCLKIADCSLTHLNAMECTMRQGLALWRPSQTRQTFLAGGACNQWVINCCSIDLSFLKKTQDKHAFETADRSNSTHKWLGDYIIKEQLLFKGAMFGSWYQRGYTYSKDVWKPPSHFPGGQRASFFYSLCILFFLFSFTFSFSLHGLQAI